MCAWWCACARNMRHLSFAHCAWRMKSCLSLSRVSEYGLTMCCCRGKNTFGKCWLCVVDVSVMVDKYAIKMCSNVWCYRLRLRRLTCDDFWYDLSRIGKAVMLFFFLPKTAVVVARESIITSELMLSKLRGHGWNTHSLNYRVHKRFTIVIIGINYFRIYSHSDNLCSDSQ